MGAGVGRCSSLIIKRKEKKTPPKPFAHPLVKKSKLTAYSL